MAERDSNCVSYAKTIDPGRPEAATAILQNACDHGYSASCSALGTYYFQGNGVAKNTSTGVALLERACEGTDTGTCLVLGERYEQGVGVSADPVRAARYLTRACESGIVSACSEAQKIRQGSSRP